MARFTRLADWLSWQETLHPRAIDLGLDRLHRTLAQLGWQPPTCPVITIGGTNGKGSSVALLSRILAAQGYRVGSFTSPHLIRYNERIHIDDREVSDAALMAAFERIDAARGPETLTFFEFNTLAALLIFESAKLDAVVLEVGMGGRLDAVNIVDADVALVTTIALDHCEWLGPDVETIGAEKAGIFRPDRVAVFGSRTMPHSIDSEAQRIGSTLLRLGRDFDFQRRASSWDWRSSRGSMYRDLPPPALFGAAQFDNASAVLQVLESLQSRLPVDRSAIESGLRNVRLPGRFQSVVVGAVEWVLDVAHNPAAAATLAEQLRSAPARRTIALCGILSDKDVEGIARALSGTFSEWVVTALEGARAIDPHELARRLRAEGANVLDVAPSIEQACEVSERAAKSGDRIVVFGSFLTVGPALEWLRSERGVAD